MASKTKKARKQARTVDLHGAVVADFEIHITDDSYDVAGLEDDIAESRVLVEEGYDLASAGTARIPLVYFPDDVGKDSHQIGWLVLKPDEYMLVGAEFHARV